MNNCGQRAFRAGLRYCGRMNAVPELLETKHIRIYAAAYGLKVTAPGAPFTCNNEPILVVYKETRERDVPPPTYHAVFLSDAGPILDGNLEVEIIVYGWNEIQVNGMSRLIHAVRGLVNRQARGYAAEGVNDGRNNSMSHKPT